MLKPRDLKPFEEKRKNDINPTKESSLGKGHTPRKMLKYLWSELKHLLHNYCETTSLHGFRHITGKRLSFIENLIWAIICLTAATFCIVLMRLSYLSTRDRLFFIQLTNLESPLYELDFPAVTICNFNKVYKPKADKMREKLMRADFSNHEIDLFFRNIPQLVRPATLLKEKNLNYVKFNEMLYILSSDLNKLMRELMQPCDKLLKSCTWMGITYDCLKLFKTVDSFVGQCCGFNYHVSRTFTDRNYSPQCKESYDNYNLDGDIQCTNRSECPGRKSVLKSPGLGMNIGLSVELNIEPELYLGSIRNYTAAYIIIHGSKDFPETDILTMTAQKNYEINAVVSGTVLEAHDEIRTLTKAQRKCILHEEVPYDHSYQSCLSGCKLKRIMTACNCVPYYYPRNCNISGACDFKNIDCIRKYHYQITNLYEEKTLDNGKILEKCHCQQLCNTTSYRLSSLDKNRRFNSQDLSMSPKTNSSIVNVFFQEYGYHKYERSLFWSWTDLVARLGGLTGLCLGGSFISLMEPIIYLLLTPFRRAHHRKIRRERKEAEANKRAEENPTKHEKNLHSETLNMYRTYFM